LIGGGELVLSRWEQEKKNEHNVLDTFTSSYLPSISFVGCILQLLLGRSPDKKNCRPIIIIHRSKVKELEYKGSKCTLGDEREARFCGKQQAPNRRFLCESETVGLTEGRTCSLRFWKIQRRNKIKMLDGETDFLF
jgi:hypothetical protein